MASAKVSATIGRGIVFGLLVLAPLVVLAPGDVLAQGAPDSRGAPEGWGRAGGPPPGPGHDAPPGGTPGAAGPGRGGSAGPGFAPVDPAASSMRAAPAPGTIPGASLIEDLNRALERALAVQVPTPPLANTLIARALPAKPSPVVVELFTSQGCAACPPADAALAEVASRSDVLALSLHVDYWDYLGWEDPFAQPAFTARQKAYTRAAGQRTLYTPQVIVGGTQAITAPGVADLEALIAADKAEAASVTMTVTPGAGAGQFAIDLTPLSPLKQGTVVQIVRYVPQARVEILRGENAGQVLDFVNVVTAWHAVAEWDGKAPVRLNARIEGEEPAAVIVQTALPGKTVPLPGSILAAGWLR